MNKIEWNGESEFSLCGVNFCCAETDYSLKTNDERVILLKHPRNIETLITYFSDKEPKTILEFGIFEGGSPAFYSTLFDLDKIVGIDLRPRVEGFESFIQKHALFNKIKNYYNVSQDDATRVEDIITKEFAGRPIDLIVDDASHFYEQTKRSFEIAFPHLKPGGTYVIEDWGWAHWAQRLWETSTFAGRKPMSMLVFELCMACASRPEIIREVRVYPSAIFITKEDTQAARDLKSFSLDNSYNINGMRIIANRSLRDTKAWAVLAAWKRRIKAALGR